MCTCRERAGAWLVVSVVVLSAILAGCGGGGGGGGGNETLLGTLQGDLSLTGATAPLDGIGVMAKEAGSGNTVAQTTMNGAGHFVMNGVPAGHFTMEMDWAGETFTAPFDMVSGMMGSDRVGNMLIDCHPDSTDVNQNGDLTEIVCDMQMQNCSAAMMGNTCQNMGGQVHMGGSGHMGGGGMMG